MGYYEGISVADINKMDGVKDLPMSVRSKFIKALKLESDGKHDEASQALNEAVETETKLKNEAK